MRILLVLVLIELNHAARIKNQDSNDPLTEWNKFKTENNLKLNDIEERIRFNSFKQHQSRVKLHNQAYRNKRYGFETKLNRFSMMSQDEYLDTYLIANHETSSTLIQNKLALQINHMPSPSMQLDSVENVPESFDWRSLNLVSRPGHQYKCGSCWAFASASAVETLYAQKYGKLIELSKQELVDCTPENRACNGGWPLNGFYHAYTLGLIEEQHYPYVSKTKNCSETSTKQMKRYKIKGFRTIRSGDEEELKRAVALYGPVTISIDASDWAFFHYSNGIYDGTNCQKNLTNHAALVVGYGSENNQDYWIVKNSWGTGWGLDGYIKMARNKNNTCGISSAATYAYL